MNQPPRTVRCELIDHDAPLVHEWRSVEYTDPLGLYIFVAHRRQGLVRAAWVAGQMFINFAETIRDPASFWTPQAYARLRQIKAAVDSQVRIRSNHPIPPAVLP